MSVALTVLELLAFNAQKFRVSRDPGHAPFWGNFFGVVFGLSLGTPKPNKVLGSAIFASWPVITLAEPDGTVRLVCEGIAIALRFAVIRPVGRGKAQIVIRRGRPS